MARHSTHTERRQYVKKRCNPTNSTAAINVLKRYTQFYYCYFIEVYDKTSTEFIYDEYYTFSIHVFALESRA